MPDNLTLPPYDPCERQYVSKPTHVLSMAHEVILHEGFSEGVSYLTFGIDRKYFN